MQWVLKVPELYLEALHDQTANSASAHNAYCLALQVIGILADGTDVPAALSDLFMRWYKVPHEHKNLQA